MKEPRRWLEDPSTSAELTRVLGAAAPPPRLPPSVQASVGEYAAKLVAQGVLAKVGGASMLHSLLGTTGGKALGVLSILGAAGVGTYALQQTRSQSDPTASRFPAPREVAPPVTQSARSPVAKQAQAPVVPSQQAASASSGPRRSARGASASTQQVVESAEPAPAATAAAEPAGGALESALPAEAKLLQTARSFLGDSPALALELSERHQREYPNGQLGAEREFIAIAALLGLGRRQEAEQRAAPALSRAPDSLYARRLRSLLEGKR